ncbi:hypothetical protein DICVIV_14025 [Dictyocaulus viviparus]|uniref:Immunoglobulin I-set domain-containing protein n=1 Tax=Dictyocaulus viviparus TaxID=29172 RepID=A0A0D8X690_DICVI|nr:hypothetical protein DICVIV_14025 [Dictyocaulus viviparus]
MNGVTDQTSISALLVVEALPMAHWCHEKIVLPGGICELVNPEVCPEDSGLYKCTATNPHGTAETAAYIDIEGTSYEKRYDMTSTNDSGLPSLPKVSQPPKFVEQINAETDAAHHLNYVRLVCKIDR